MKNHFELEAGLNILSRSAPVPGRSTVRACPNIPERGCVVLDQPQQASNARRIGPLAACCGWSLTQPRSFFRPALWQVARVAATVAFCLMLPLMARAQQLVTQPDSTAIPPATGGGDSCQPIISPDGRFVLFASRAHNLATNIANTTAPARMNVFLRDRSNAVTIPISLNVQGSGLANGDSFPTALSTNGQFVLFESSASDVVTGDTNGATDIFLRDVATGTNCLISVSTTGGFGNRDSHAAVMTPDARVVAFSSSATNLVANDTNGIRDVFVRDLQAGITTLASRGATNSGTRSDSPQLTPDGRYVAFLSSAAGLVPTNLSLANAVYVHDLTSSTITLVNSNIYKRWSTPPNACNFSISDDAQFVAFEYRDSTSTNGLILRCDLLTQATNTIYTNAIASYSGLNYFKSLDTTPDGRVVVFVGRTTNSTSSSGVFAWDELSGTTTLISTNLSGETPTNSVCEWPRIDPSGRWVVFLSTATNLTTNVVAGEFHCYVHDLQTGETILVDAGTNGVGTAKEFLSTPQMSADGRWVVFDCSDADLAPGDHNHAYDVFVRDLTTNTCELISVRHPAQPSQTPTGANLSTGFDVSADGRFVAFSATGEELLPSGYTNLYRGVFVRDLLYGTNVLVSANTNGFCGANAPAFEPSLSGDGRFVAFTSSASDLVTNDANHVQDVFVKDLQAGDVKRIAASTSGNSPASYSPKISSDGRYLLFRSTNGPTASEQLYFRDLQASTNRSFTSYNYGVTAAAMTPDARFVTYVQTTSSLYSYNLFVWDSQTGTTVYTNNTTTKVTHLAISADGSLIAFVTNAALRVIDRAANLTWSAATNFFYGLAGAQVRLQFTSNARFLVYACTGPQVAADTNALADVYLHDLSTRSNRLISRSCNWPGAARGKSDSPTISPDGRFITYRSTAADIVPGDTNEQADVFLYDLQTDTTTRIVGDFGTSLPSFAPIFSADSQTLVFGSWAADLAPNDFNDSADLFSLKLYTSNAAPAFACQVIFAPSPSQNLVLAWPAVAGKNYRVEFKDELTDPVWQNLNTTVTIVGDQAYAADYAATPTRRFYRIVAY
jgi:Tol biopolymer transport system component